MTGFGVQPHVPAGLFDESVHLREPEARSFADVLGREERLERLREDLLVHAVPRVGHADRDVATRLQIDAVGAACEPAISTFCVSIVSLPPSGMASRALRTRFRIMLSSWFGSASVSHSAVP